MKFFKEKWEKRNHEEPKNASEKVIEAMLTIAEIRL